MDVLTDLLRSLFRGVQSFRLKFREPRGNYSECDGFFLKVSESDELANREKHLMAKIMRARPEAFRVPRVLEPFRSEGANDAVVMMERIDGTPLELFIYKYIFFGQLGVINIFYRLGQAIREFHKLHPTDDSYLRVPCSKIELTNEIRKLVNSLVHLGVIKPRSETLVGKRQELDLELMEIVNLHGEAYFSHVMISNGTFVFLDMEKTGLGPLYYDLATFTVSILSSIFLPKPFIPKLLALRSAFFHGYFGKRVPLESIKEAELYVLLHEADMLCSNSVNFTENFARRLLRTLKLKRFQWLISKSIKET